ncbi:triose-phosphate isomerase [Brevibacterium casei]|uniref:Triosephosphate isomerase n=2 Tax=Brevibacterium casei TaxID=33889 RepID=A0A165DW63_9MICO|nr:triose-phosphate isomerase [Brevibacterium casei]KZE18218.1 triose-phosphate isomerase [Brevibacterium casei]MCT1551730.1 triose-phosphate isomerase [Brevibacterium casei]MCT1561826.1 triose-phosphate isomerase [Brevibacterium casei]MCT2184392.1 triose-phosphate isomerase [Brevibacterium casei]MCT2209477.1 triose-phosphate isomerase [Brevibacterium casei]
MTDRTLLLAGNWKMNHDHLEAISTVQKLAWALEDAKLDDSQCEVVVIPPFTDIRSVQTLVQGDKLWLRYGAQDVSRHEPGAHTGEIAATFLSRLGCTYVVVGHSERRADNHETNDVVAAKVKAALGHDLVPILCVGESLDQREDGTHVEFTLAQLEESLAGLSAEDLTGLVIAYEPVWAIGTGKTATAEDAAEMAAAIRGWLREIYGDSLAESTRILYGGSVKTDNVADILVSDDVDGALVGGASLSGPDFAALCKAAVGQ